jgi:NAD(P)-dependent dehydrogenase (short-subunit alcohol dehydrogenase family)
MTKAAIKLLTRCMAVELAEYGILVNAIGPGFIKTSIVDIPDEAYDEVAKIVPMQRCGVGDDIAGAAIFLASSDSDYATGSTVMVDGGYTAQ